MPEAYREHLVQPVLVAVDSWVRPELLLPMKLEVTVAVVNHAAASHSIQYPAVAAAAVAS